MKKNFKYKRIIILGGSGSGKSTLANRISRYTGYPIYHLDNLFLDSNWKTKSREEREEISKQFLFKDIGVVDGNYTSSIPQRINWADLIIFIDISTRAHLYRIFKRMFKIILGLEKRHGKPQNSKNIVNLIFIKWVYFWNKHRRNEVLLLLESAKDKKVVIIKEPRKLDLEKLFK